MKIRIRGNSVRLRLTKSEVEAFCLQGYFSESTLFTTKSLTYELRIKKGIESLEAEFTNNTISIFIPDEKAMNWDKNEIVGFKDDFALKNGEKLYLLVEKDFVCLDGRDEDESDNYPNPLATKI